jgi:D-3-phosphoglycerate dehydrogenase
MTKKLRVLVSTFPFGQLDFTPIRLLESANLEFVINPIGRKLKESELEELISDFDILIAGTEVISAKVISHAKHLKLIARVGIGLDNVDLLTAKKNGIIVTYTPDAPAKAVSDLTIGLMISLLRQIHISNVKMHEGNWYRFFGRRVGEVTIGLIGMGRIGLGVMSRLQGFGCKKILVHDIKPNHALENAFDFEWTDLDRIYKESDVISLHVPLTKLTKGMIGKSELLKMKSDAFIINTSRGGIINESDLFQVLKSGHLGGAAIDVFEQEPYMGELKNIQNCILTSHMGSMSIDCRSRMETEATQEVLRFVQGLELIGLVPAEDYSNQIL